jgi:peptide/nickel transport system permease protein
MWRVISDMINKESPSTGKNTTLVNSQNITIIRVKRIIESACHFMKLLFINKLTGAAIILIMLLIITAILAPIIAPYPDQGLGAANPQARFLPPSSEHLFGTDEMGRDIFSRIIFGTRISLTISTVTVILALCIALPLGLISGYYGGFVDEVLMRITDVFLSFPPLLIAIVIASFMGPSLNNAVLAIVIAWWPWYSRIVRAQTIAIKERPFVKAAKCIGTSDLVIMFNHILPNTIAPVIIQASMDMGGVILTAASLSFIGLGAQPPVPEWGLIISSARTYIIDAWWYSAFPGLVIFVTVLSFNLIGDGLREVLDPRTRVR